MAQHLPGSRLTFGPFPADVDRRHVARLRDGASIEIRSWLPSDALGMQSLLDDTADSVWVTQFHALHGPDHDGPDWRGSVVAVDEFDRVLGCASVAANRIHTSRLPCAIDVHPEFRRRGIGRALLQAVKAARPVLLPLSTKVRISNIAAMGFLSSVGATAYQRCLSVVIDPEDPAVQLWATAHSDTECSSLLVQNRQRLSELFARQYMWVHHRWSPVGDPDLLNAVASSEIDAIDPAASTCAWRNGEIVAVVFAFPTATESALEVVAETVKEHQPSGTELLAAALACTIRAAARRHSLLEFDGHITDPHLHPVLSELPWLRSDPIDLVQIT